ncbi:C-type lectin 37Db-like [Scaptodrosophila lebanonensis]|uniref:C-type lectin 37Db-like n=1 Tax=Drosophila lebanonensis TaxID=7225 RepID=A0A6J2TZ52_DROLE|nr:C-type lectin 37Db-like [Scaptodrosophila lebanonensis]
MNESNIITLFVVQIVSICSAIRTNEGAYTKIGSKYYYIEMEKKLMWSTALEKCQILGGHLAHLESEKELAAISEHLDQGKWYWVDITDVKSEGEYVSSTTNRQASFFRWMDGDPNNKNNNEHCVHLIYYKSKFFMNDLACDSTISYICEMD